MSEELLTQLWQNCRGARQKGLVRFTESVRFNEHRLLSFDDTISVRNGVFLWTAIASDYAKLNLDEQGFKVFSGRVVQLPNLILGHPDGIASFLGMLDSAEDGIIAVLSSESSPYKGDEIYQALKQTFLLWSEDFWRCMAPLVRHATSGILNRYHVRFLRQLTNLLSKLELDRSDLLSDHYSEYFEAEELIRIENLMQTQRCDSYWSLVSDMRRVLSPVVKNFKFDFRQAKHGPGAVADPTIKTQLDKFANMGLDARINYMVHKELGETQQGLSPLPLRESNRTSRVVFVPKTWKKLRGISAEPVELQYYQQAIFGSICRAMQGTDLAKVVNFFDQSISRRMALQGSCDGSLATIDLSSASDSVTVQLVRDVFGSTSLCRWLLATRSTHTLINNQRLEISKFAPMGSACCFPVESLLFAAVCLAVAGRKRKKFGLSKFQIFGDDIICPSEDSEDVVEALTILGFTVNQEKSFTSGDYRESCGVDAWCGCEVTPLKVKDLSYDFIGTHPISYEQQARTVDYINTLYHLGYWGTRTFLLRKFRRCPIRLKGETIDVNQAVVFGSGSHGDIASHVADNFQAKTAPVKGLFRKGFVRCMWKPRRRRAPKLSESLIEEVNYFVWLQKNSSANTSVVRYDLEFFRSRVDAREEVTYQEQKMVPTFVVWDPWYDLYHWTPFNTMADERESLRELEIALRGAYLEPI